MQTSIDRNRGGIEVIIHPQKGEAKNGRLYYKSEGPVVVLNNEDILDVLDGVTFSVIEGSTFEQTTKIRSESRILVKPEVVTELSYSKSRRSGLWMYPPSTGDWLTHVVESGVESVFTIQQIIGESKLFLTIFGKKTMEMFYAGLIQPYESSILAMDRDWNVLNKIYYADVQESDVLKILKEKSLPWSTLDKLVEGVTIPDLKLGETNEETLTQLVPELFSPNVREQIMAFLAWLDNAEIPREDPLDFVIKHRSASVFDSLVRNHLKCILDIVDPPPYIRILHLAERGQIELAQRPRLEAAEQDPWNLVLLKLHELFPDWTGRVVEHITSLQSKGQIITKLPVSKENALASRKAWSARFAMANEGLTIRGYICQESIGLLPIIYVGGAHRWPHKHLVWSARLGYGTEKPQYIQIMVMPKSALERVSRIIPTVRLVNWDMASVNVSLYNERHRKWNLKINPIIKSLERKRSVRQLTNEFGRWKGKNTLQLSQQQAKVLDLISWGMTLGDLETERYSKFYGIDNSTIKRELDNMHKHGVFSLQYFLIPEKLRSLYIAANGNSENICSMSRAFLKHTPSTQVRITEDGASCFIVSRVPEDEYYNLITKLNDAANETGISLKIAPISAYVGYRNNLYSRLLKNDGSWDDDVSGLLSQVRLQSK